MPERVITTDARVAGFAAGQKLKRYMKRKTKRIAQFELRGALIRLNEVSDAHGKRFAVVWGPERKQISFPRTAKGKRAAHAFIEGLPQGVTAAAEPETRGHHARVLGSVQGGAVATTPESDEDQ